MYTGTGEGKRVYIKDGKEYHRKSAYSMGIKTIKDAEERGFVYHKGKPKHRYLYIIGDKRQKKQMIKQIKYPILPYPKGDNTNYDTGSFDD